LFNIECRSNDPASVAVSNTPAQSQEDTVGGKLSCRASEGFNAVPTVSCGENLNAVTCRNGEHEPPDLLLYRIVKTILELVDQEYSSSRWEHAEEKLQNTEHSVAHAAECHGGGSATNLDYWKSVCGISFRAQESRTLDKCEGLNFRFDNPKCLEHQLCFWSQRYLIPQFSQLVFSNEFRWNKADRDDVLLGQDGLQSPVYWLNSEESLVVAGSANQKTIKHLSVFCLGILSAEHGGFNPDDSSGRG